MRILMILDKKFPPDIRVEKETRALIKTGHTIYLLAENQGAEPHEEIIDNIHVLRNVEKKSGNIFLKIKNLLNHRYPQWERSIDRIITLKKINAVHIHDLPLVRSASLVAKKNDIPIIADLHENYPAAVNEWWSDAPFKKLVHKFARWKNHEIRTLKWCDKIIVVVRENKERLINGGITKDKISVVSNTEDIDYFLSIKINELILAQFKGNYVISYIGGFGPHRGIDTVIRAMPTIIKHIPNIKFLIVGTGNNEKKLKNLTSALNLNHCITFKGWQKFDKVASYIYASNICLIPHNKNPHTDTTIPHKLFQYMLLKKPIIVSNCNPLERVIEETNAGLIFRSMNHIDLTKKVFAIFNNPNNYGINGYNAVISKYNWGNDSKSLLKIYH